MQKPLLSCKKGTLINFARAELVDNEALFEAIEAGVIKRFMTDFGTEELLNKRASLSSLTSVVQQKRQN